MDNHQKQDIILDFLFKDYERKQGKYFIGDTGGLPVDIDGVKFIPSDFSTLLTDLRVKGFVTFVRVREGWSITLKRKGFDAILQGGVTGQNQIRRKENQELDKIKKEERETRFATIKQAQYAEEANRIAYDANRIAKDANTLAHRSIIIAIVSAGIAIGSVMVALFDLFKP